MEKAFAALLIAAQLSVPWFTSASYDLGSAQGYLSQHSSNPWSTIALSALGQNPTSTDYLKSVEGSSAIEYTAPILAITAIGQNPRTFGSKDYVAELKKFHQDGQIGDPATVNDDIFGLLALSAAGEASSDPVVDDALRFLKTHQHDDGGWGFAVNGSSDSNMTAASITALISFGVSPSETSIQNALAYLKTAQNGDGGFTYDPSSSYGTSSDSSSTAWVLWALNAAGISSSSWSKDGHSPVSYLESNQSPEGFFRYQSGSPEDAFSANTTAYAVIALSGKTLPLRKVAASNTFPFRIEGKDSVVCSGQAEGPTALDVVKNASTQCGYAYSIKTTSYGPYLESINSDKASGMIGWLYLVNFISPQAASSEYVLKQGDAVLWYFGDFNWKPARLTLAASQTDSGKPVTATVEYSDGSSWLPLAGAQVYYGTSNAMSGADGTVTISSPDGYYQVYAEKDGYIRSNRQLLKVGSPGNNEVELKATITSGEVEGSTVSFVVDAASLDFGTLKPGENRVKNFSVTNTGTVGITIESRVTGDSVFTDNLQVNGTSWRDFQRVFSAGQNSALQATLAVPTGYTGGAGAKSGTITFWAVGE